jgi:hypothetical protein
MAAAVRAVGGWVEAGLAVVGREGLGMAVTGGWVAQGMAGRGRAAVGMGAEGCSSFATQLGCQTLSVELSELQSGSAGNLSIGNKPGQAISQDTSRRPTRQ